MKLPAFNYVAPHSLDDACGALASDEDAKLIAGGQSLMPLMAMRLSQPTTVIDLTAVPDLNRIEPSGGFLRIGAMVTHQQVVASPIVQQQAPMLSEAGRHIAHEQIRNRGTLGGSLAHGDGAGEWPLTLLALGGMVEVQSVRGQRTVDADDLFVGPYMTSLEADEVLTDVWVPTRQEGWGFEEFARRSGDYALAAVGATWDLHDGTVETSRISVAAAVGTAQRITAAEEAVAGRPLTDEVVAEAADAGAASLSFISDMHGSASYRQGLVRELIRRVLQQGKAS